MIRKEWLNMDKEKIKDSIDFSNETLLFKANTPEEVEWLIDNNVDVNHRNFIGQTALWEVNGYYTLNKLFDLGVDADIRNFEGHSVLSSATFFAFPEVFIKHKDKYSIREVQIHGICHNEVSNMIHSINLLEGNGFTVFYPSHIIIDTDVTEWDDENAKYLTDKESCELKNHYNNSINHYIELLEFIKDKSICRKLITFTLNKNEARIFDLEEALERLRSTHIKKPNLYIVK